MMKVQLTGFSVKAYYDHHLVQGAFLALFYDFLFNQFSFQTLLFHPTIYFDMRKYVK